MMRANTKQSCNEEIPIPNGQPPSKLREVSVAIIGASYAGLTLANVLNQHNEKAAFCMTDIVADTDADTGADTDKDTDADAEAHSDAKSGAVNNISSNSPSGYDDGSKNDEQFRFQYNNKDECTDTYKCTYSYQIFESKQPPFSFIIGDFAIPSYPMILDKLQLQHLHDTTSTRRRNNSGDAGDDDDSDDGNKSDEDGDHGKRYDKSIDGWESKSVLYQRKDVICTLWKRINAHIHCGMNVKSIVETEENDNDSIFYVIASSRNAVAVNSYAVAPERVQERYGPFDIIIFADGVKSLCREKVRNIHMAKNRGKSTSACRMYVVGDARWAPDRFYDLGFRRIEQGADMAMRDGLELGGLILRMCANSESPDVVLLRQAKSKFCLTSVWKRQREKRFLLLILFASVLAVVVQRTFL